MDLKIQVAQEYQGSQWLQDLQQFPETLDCPGSQPNLDPPWHQRHHLPLLGLSTLQVLGHPEILDFLVCLGNHHFHDFPADLLHQQFRGPQLDPWAQVSQLHPTALVPQSYQCLPVVPGYRSALAVLDLPEVLCRLSVLVSPVDQQNLSLPEVLMVQADPVSPAGLGFQKPRPDQSLPEAQVDQHHHAGLLGLVDQGFQVHRVIPDPLCRLENQVNQVYL